MGHTRKDGSHLENASHLEKCVTPGKVRHTCKRPHHTFKSGADFEKCVSVGKISYSWRNVSHLKLWVALRKWIALKKWVTLGKMCCPWKNESHMEK